MKLLHLTIAEKIKEYTSRNDLFAFDEENGFFSFFYNEEKSKSLLIKCINKHVYIIHNDLNISNDILFTIFEKDLNKKIIYPSFIELNWKELKLNSINLIKEYLNSLYPEGVSACDYTIGGIFMWRKFYKMEFAEHPTLHTIYIRMVGETDGLYYYMLPLSYNRNDLQNSVNDLINYSIINYDICRFATIPMNFGKKLFIDGLEESLYNISIKEHPKYKDYLYITNNLIKLKGKKYHKIKNHINKFKAYHNNLYTIEPLTLENVDKAKNFFINIYKGDDNTFANEENKMVLEVLNHFEEYGFKGILLYVATNVVGFTLGEERFGTLFVHIEKADRTFDGVYQMLFHEFLLAYGQDCFLVNREEDMDDEGLRKSKLAYHPDGYANKFSIEVTA